MSPRTLIFATFLMVSLASAAWAESECANCVQDVVVETTDGRWHSGYIYWNRHPFRYLDLSEPHGRRELEHGSGATREIRLWNHAVSISRDRFSPDLGEPPAPAVPEYPYTRRDEEVALLVGEPTEIPVDSVRRIYPRIGSGLPAIRVSVEQLVRLAGEHLPFHAHWAGGCYGCPMTVEDVTILLKSGEWVSGLTLWPAAMAVLQGYDFREDPSRNKFAFVDWPDEMFLWPDAVSTPRRTFESAAEIAMGKLDKRRGFLRIGEKVLVVGASRVLRLEELALVLPGPSGVAYPFLIRRTDALRLLLEPPSLTMSASGNFIYLFCFGYGPDVTLDDLIRVCDPGALEAAGYQTGVLHPRNLVVGSPSCFDRREMSVPALEKDATLITLWLDEGT